MKTNSWPILLVSVQVFYVLFNISVKYDNLYSCLVSLLSAGSRFDMARRQENKPITPMVSRFFLALQRCFSCLNICISHCSTSPLFVFNDLYYFFGHRRHALCSTTSWCSGGFWEFCLHPKRTSSSWKLATVTPARAISCTLSGGRHGYVSAHTSTGSRSVFGSGIVTHICIFRIFLLLRCTDQWVW